MHNTHNLLNPPLPGYDPERRTVTDSTAGETRIVTHPAAAPAGPLTMAVGGGMPTTVVGSGGVAAGTGVPGPSAGQRVTAGPIGAGRGMPVR